MYVSDRYPRFPLKKQLREERAIVGTLRNSAGQYLLGISRQLSMTQVQISAEPPTAPAPKNSGDAVRGIRGALDPSGFVWLEERELSRSWLQRSIDGQREHQADITGD